MKKLYVTDRKGKRIPGQGARSFGEFFELEDDVADEYAKADGFALRAPSKPKTAIPEVVPIPEVEEFDNE